MESSTPSTSKQSTDIETDVLLDEIETPTPITISNDDREQSITSCPQSLHPKVPKPHVFQPMELNFARKFAQRRGGKLSRDDFEELLNLKVTEAIVYREKNSKLRVLVDRHVLMIASLQERLTNAIKQYHDLQMAHARVMRDINNYVAGEEPVQVLKIVRDVGLQVYQQQLTEGMIPTIDLEAEEEDTRNPFNRSPVRSPTPEVQPVPRPRNRVKRRTEVENKNRKRKKSPQTFTSLNSTVIEDSSEDEGRSRKRNRVVRRGGKSAQSEKSVQSPKKRKNVEKNSKNSSEGEKSSKGDGKRVQSPEKGSETQENDKNQRNSRTSAKRSREPDNNEESQIPKRKSSETQSQVVDKTLEVPSIIIKPDDGSATNKLDILENLQEAVKKFSEMQEPLVRPLASSTPMIALNSSFNLSPPSVQLPPLPPTPHHFTKPNSKKTPPKPKIDIEKTEKGIKLLWNIDGLDANHADILKYEIYAYEVTNEGSQDDGWKIVGDAKALLLPMAVTLTQFGDGQKFYFAVRAVDVHKRMTEFSEPKTWL